MSNRQYKDVLGFDPPVFAIVAIILTVLAFATGCVAIGYALAKFF
jgi:hypothetical protein